MPLSHVDQKGQARMVDVSGKETTARLAIAEGRIKIGAEAFNAVEDNTTAKGDVLAAARLAGIMAAKKTPELIPLCHPLPLTSVKVDLSLNWDESAIEVRAETKTMAVTGVEMEALTAATVALLTIYDMLKAVDKSMIIGPVRLVYKSGGKSGIFEA